MMYERRHLCTIRRLPRSNDPTKLSSYLRLLARKLDDDGKTRGSKLVLSVLDKMGSGQAVMDILTVMPVDQ